MQTAGTVAGREESGKMRANPSTADPLAKVTAAGGVWRTSATSAGSGSAGRVR